MREIITLQLGQHSNYLATHFWNTQESYFTYGDEGESPVDHDVHFRPGIGADGSETYMPRTVIYDLKGGFGSMRKINSLYEVEEPQDNPTSLWGGKTVVQKQAPIQPSSYQASLDAGTAPPELTTSTVRYWSDFNRVFFHPRSIVQLNEYELNSTLLPFEKWNMGEDLFSSLDKDHDIVDRDLRPFIEEADQMQGVQVMAGIDDAWGGFASRYMERMRDEYGKTPIWVWGVQDPTVGLPREKRLLRLVNKARAIADMYSQASLLIPFSIPQTRLPNSVYLDQSSTWHVSALFSAALESTSLYTRLRTSDGTNSTSFGHVTDALNVFGKQTIANLQLSPVAPSTPASNGHTGPDQVLTSRGELSSAPMDLDFEEEAGSESGNDVLGLDIDLSSLEEGVTHSTSLHSRRKTHLFSQLSTSRGNGLEPLGERLGSTDIAAAARRRIKTYGYQSALPFPVLSSYPHIFRDTSGSAVKNPMSMRTVLSTDSSVTEKMRGLRNTVLRFIELEDREDIGNELAEIAAGYQEGWSSGSDDDDDD